MPKFRKKPVVIEAFKYGADELPDWFMANAERFDEVVDGCKIHTLEGTMLASAGDYIIKGVQGEFYPCKPDIFESTYDAAE